MLTPTRKSPAGWLWGRGAFAPAVLLLGVAAAVFPGAGSPPRMQLSGESLGERLPMHWGEWAGSELALTANELDELEPQSYIYRSYRRETAGGRPVVVMVLYWGTNVAKPHAPELCLSSADYAVFDERQVQMPDSRGVNSAINVFRARRGMTERVIYYWWYTDRGATPDFGAFKKTTALRGVLGQPSWGAFVRVESGGLKEEAADLEAACREVSEELLRLLPGAFRLS